MQPRGIRNHNPGNIRLSADKWQGLAKEQTDSEFFVFKDPIYGIRAMARLLINYQDKHARRTIQRIIERYAPASENNVEAYVDSVATFKDFDPDQELDLHRFEHLEPLIRAMIYHENGQQPYSDAQITKALVLAGVEPPSKGLSGSRTIKGGRLASLGLIGTGATDAAEQIAPYIAYSDYIQYAFFTFIFIGIAIMMWARIDDFRKALR